MHRPLHTSCRFKSSLLRSHVSLQAFPAFALSSPGGGFTLWTGESVSCNRQPLAQVVPVSALRLCLSARLMVEGASTDGRHASSVIDRAMQVLDQVNWLAHRA